MKAEGLNADLCFWFIYSGVASGQFQCPRRRSSPATESGTTKANIHACAMFIKVRGGEANTGLRTAGESTNHCCTLLSVTPSGTTGAS
ncbi:hypothetical protein KCP70_07425 [Salmonella enterica subsp. enterica]|nr:hypothetical protein KCP70_07425 [Salmonella enterica subsp. enterica]